MISNDFRINYKVLISSILPRPIALISTLNSDGSYNVAPFSFFTAVSASPMVIAFSPMIRTSTSAPKDTAINIWREKEFVINIVHENIMEAVNLTSAELRYGEDEFIHSGLTPIPSTLVKAPRVKESFIQFECKYLNHLTYGEGPGSGSIITGEVIDYHISPSVLNSEGEIDTNLLKPVGRGAGQDWILSNSRKTLPRFTKTFSNKNDYEKK